MESSPLNRAHEHARAAAVATRQASDSTVAVSEHTQAAGEFANAAKKTTSLEALRTLKLLEDHHRKLAFVLNLPPGQASSQPPADDDLAAEKSPVSEKAQESSAATKSVQPKSSKDGAYATSQKPALHHQSRFAPRDLSSSIASNLASARGIRSKSSALPISPSVSNHQAPGNVGPHPRKDGSKARMQHIIQYTSAKPSWVPPTSLSSPKSDSRSKRMSSVPGAGHHSPENADDGAYARFSSTFGNLLNKISAPLAFAGLPLTGDDALPTDPSEAVGASSSGPAKSSGRNNTARAASTTPSPAAEPDLAKIYSPATMRALIRDGHNVNESFYVVPTSGHTMSYANILTYAEKEKRRLGASTQGSPVAAAQTGEEEDFVDAREAPASPSTGPGPRGRGAKKQTERELYNAIEELSLENRSLKGMLDNVSRRLHAFEASSQHSAMALAESYRVMRPASPPGTASRGRWMDERSKSKMHDMEEQLAAAAKQMEKLEKDNRKMQKTLEKYREKWDLLKAGARARREAQGTADGGEEDRQT